MRVCLSVDDVLAPEVAAALIDIESLDHEVLLGPRLAETDVDALVVMPGWGKSVRVRADMIHAECNGVPVYVYDSHPQLLCPLIPLHYQPVHV